MLLKQLYAVQKVQFFFQKRQKQIVIIGILEMEQQQRFLIRSLNINLEH